MVPNKVERAPSGNRTFLGRFQNETVRFHLEHLAPHQSVEVLVDLFVIGIWEGNSPENGPDVITVKGPGGAVLMDASFSNFPDYRY